MKDNSTGKNKEFYDLGKKMFDRIRVLPEHQTMAATPHAELIAELMNPNNPKNEREHAAVREIERLQEALAQPEERYFCPRCGKRTADLATIHTCTPPIAADPKAFHGFPSGSVSAPNAGGKCVTAGETAPVKEIDPNAWAFDRGLEST